MNLKEIEVRANSEPFPPIGYYKDKIRAFISEYPDGIDITLPISLIPRIIEYCDAANIPIYYLGRGKHCSVAATYTQLLAHEQEK